MDQGPRLFLWRSPFPETTQRICLADQFASARETFPQRRSFGVWERADPLVSGLEEALDPTYATPCLDDREQLLSAPLKALSARPFK